MSPALVLGVVLASVFALVGFLLAWAHTYAKLEKEQRKKHPFPARYEAVKCDCTHDMKCPQGRDPSQPRCEIWKGVYDA